MHRKMGAFFIHFVVLNIHLVYSVVWNQSNNIRVNEGVYEGCTAPMKDVNKGYVVIHRDQLDDKRFQDE